jgi:putative transposase
LADKLKALERENRELGQANEILRKASACDGGARPPVQAMIAFIDDHREAHGIEPICKALPIVPSTYHAHVAKRRPGQAVGTARRDSTMKIDIRRVFEENFRGLRRAQGSGGSSSAKRAGTTEAC